MEEESAGGLACLGWEAIDAEMVRDGVESVLLALCGWHATWKQEGGGMQYVIWSGMAT